MYLISTVYTYIKCHIFTDFVINEFDNNFFLFSHCNPKHIIYNIGITNVQLEENILFLKGIAKTIFSNLNDIKVRDIIAKF
jgi:hypothetical protein